MAIENKAKMCFEAAVKVYSVVIVMIGRIILTF